MDQRTIRIHVLQREALFYFFIFVIACAMGVISHLLLTALHVVTAYRESHPYLLFFLPLAGLFTAFVYQNYGQGADKGNNLIIESTYSTTKVPLRMAFFTFFFTILTHLFGGSAGREGSAVQIGGVLSNKTANYFHLSKQQRTQMIHSGISAGFASIFGTPLAGAFFGMEMVYVGKLERLSLFPCFLAAYVANFVSLRLGTVHEVHQMKLIPTMDWRLVLIVSVSAILFGVFGRLFSAIIRFLKTFYQKKLPNYLIRALVSATVVVGLLWLCHGQKYEGLSLQMITDSFTGTVSWVDSVMKLLFTGLTLGAGFQGGEVTPLFGIGATLGSSIGQLTGVSPSFLAALGMISVFGCAANTPLTTVMLGIDLFGAKALPYYVLTAFISYIVSGHRGIYSSQIIIHAKTPFLKEQEGKKLSEISK